MHRFSDRSAPITRAVLAVCLVTMAAGLEAGPRQPAGAGEPGAGRPARGALRAGYAGRPVPQEPAAPDAERTLTRYLFAASSFSISSITRFIFFIVSSRGSSVVMSTPASLSRSIGYFEPPAPRNAT